MGNARIPRFKSANPAPKRLGSPESTAKRAAIWNALSRCLSRGVTTISPFRFGQDTGVAAMLYLALTLWPMGDIERAISLGRDAEARMASLAHVHTRVFGEHLAAMFELMRGNCSRAAPHAVEAARLAREHDLSLWRAVGVSFGSSNPVMESFRFS
jgi:hypothetical protein